MNKLSAILLALIGCVGCAGKPVLPSVADSDHTSRANAIRYMSTHDCHETYRVKGKIYFNAYTNRVERTEGRTDYSCKGLDTWILIPDGEEQP